MSQLVPWGVAGIRGHLGGLAHIFNRRNDNLQVSEPAIDAAAQSSHHLTTLRFSDLVLSPGMQRGIAEAGFE